VRPSALPSIVGQRASSRLAGGGRTDGAAGGSERTLGMTKNSIALILAKVATMGLGFAFWLVAARWFASDEVGLAASAVSAMMLCTQFALLGAGSAFIALFPEHSTQPSRLIDTSFTVVTLVALAAGVVFLFVAQTWFAQLGPVVTLPLFTAFFLAMVIFGTLGILLDQASTVLRRGDQALWRNLLSGVLTLVALAVLVPLPGTSDATAIFSTWVGGGIAACALGVVQLRRSVAGWHLRPRIDRRMTRRLLSVGLPNHLLTLTDRAPGLVLPIIVVEVLSPSAGARWYTVWMMAWIVFIVPIQVGMTLFAETAHRSKPLGQLVRRGLRTSLLLGAAAAAVLSVFAPLVLSLLGHSYADDGAGPLRILVWSVIPLAFLQAYYAACRGSGRITEATGTAVTFGAAAVAAALGVAPGHGLTGLALSWLAVQAAAGTWSLFRLRAIASTTPVPPAPVVAVPYRVAVTGRALADE
jgi:O-antigen/teichoic acid export membrane protein